MDRTYRPTRRYAPPPDSAATEFTIGTDDDHTLLVNNDGLPPAELLDGAGDLVYCSIGYEASIPGVSNRTIYGPRFDKHTRSQINVLASFGECALRSSSEPKLFLL
jgi:hypothetical protein